MVHVRDVARTLVAALETASEGTVLGDVVSVGPHPDASLNVNQVANIICNVVEFRGGPKQPEIIHSRMRPGEVPGDRVSADPWTLRQVGIDPESLIPFEVGIRETIDWFAESWLPGYLAMQNDDTVVMATIT
jgi:nucleoside-diphosphate-sugar epimerase